MPAEIDVSQEKTNLLVGVLLGLLGGIPYIGWVFAVLGIFMIYNGFSGYEEKLGLKSPREKYLKGVIVGIVGTIILLGAFIAILYVTAPGSPNEDYVYTSHFTDAYHHTYHYEIDNSGEEDEILGSLLFLLIGAWTVILGAVYYVANAYAELGKFFGIKEFETYKTLAYITYGPFPLWIIIPIIGWIILAILGIVAFVYLILAITKLPDRWSKENELQGINNFDPIVY